MFFKSLTSCNLIIFVVSLTYFLQDFEMEYVMTIL